MDPLHARGPPLFQSLHPNPSGSGGDDASVPSDFLVGARRCGAECRRGAGHGLPGAGPDYDVDRSERFF